MTFNWKSPQEGYYLLEKNKVDGISDEFISLKDMDGALTGIPGSTLVKTNMYFTKGDDCSEIAGTNTQVCNQNYTRVIQFPKLKRGFGTFITKPNNPNVIHVSDTSANVRIKDAINRKYIIHFR